jgi:hypothetical protein
VKYFVIDLKENVNEKVIPGMKVVRLHPDRKQDPRDRQDRAGGADSACSVMG